MKSVGILMYDDSLMGGAERIGINLANELSLYYKTYAISLFNENVNSFFDCKCEHFVVSDVSESITKNFFSLSKKLRNYIIDKNIDVLLIITAGVNSLGVYASRNLNVKTVYCEHSNLKNRTYGLKHIFRQWVGSKFCDRVVTLTNKDRDNFISMMGISDSKVLCIPNWYTNIISDDVVYDVSSKKIITVGRLVKVKGYDLLIKVAKKVFDVYKDWSWDIYGDGPEMEYINRLIYENNLNDFVFLKGAVKDIMSKYNEYSFYVSTSYYEGLPLTLLEAQSFKLPIVSFDYYTGPSDIVNNLENGILIEPYNIDKMVQAVFDLIEDVDLRRKFSSNSLNNMYKFDKSTIILKWKNLIDNL